MRNVNAVARQWLSCVLVLIGLAMITAPAQAAIGTAFTYQGRIALAGTTVTGALDFEFEVYDAPVGGTSVGGPIDLPGVICTDGLFTVLLDFGATTFQGDRRWLEIRVSPGFPGTPYTTLLPRQELTPTPYAIWSTNSGTAAEALHATNADNATNALHADNADNATNAANATNALHANTADNATNATNAVNATNATNAVNATNATNAANAANANLLDGIDSTGFSLVGHTQPGSSITGIPPTAVVFGSAGGTLTGDAANFSYDTTLHDLNLTGVYRIGTAAVLRVRPTPFLNTFVGIAGNATVTGSSNTGVGDGALTVANTNSGNTAVGTSALHATLSLGGPNEGSNNTAVGAGAMVSNTTGFANTAVGLSALGNNLTGFINTAIGAGALLANTGSGNVAVGVQALTNNTSGGNNTAVGTSALLNNISGGSNSAFGQTALNFNNSGSGNTAIGSAAMQNNTTAGQNTAVGISAMAANTIGGGNTALGAFALAANSVNINNTAVGSTALQLATSAQNTAVGVGALKSATTGNNNVGIGLDAGNGITGANNIVIGASAGTAGLVANNIVIGHPGDAGANGMIRLGANGTHTDTRIGGIWNIPLAGAPVPVLINVNGQLGTSIASSIQFKEAVRDMGADADQLLALRPVVFRYRADIAPAGDPRPEQFGLIAEEVALINPDWAIYDKDGKIVSVRYDQVNAALLGLVQRQQAQIDALTQRMNELAGRSGRGQTAETR